MCTHTQAQTDPWWTVDLGSTQSIDQLRLWARTDCCQNRMAGFEVYVNDLATYSPTDSRFVPCPNPFTGIAQVVTLDVSQSFCNRGRYVHVALRGPNRIIHLCEVEVFQRRQWQWRALSNVFEASRGALVTQSTEERCCAGGEASRAVDGVISNNYNTQPYTCTHTQGNTGNSAIPTWLMVDLGDVFDVQYMDIWPRTDCCSWRNRRWEIYIGNSQDYNYNTRCMNVPADVTPRSPATSVRVQCAATGRYVIVRRPFLSGDDNILTICGESCTREPAHLAWNPTLCLPPLSLQSCACGPTRCVTCQSPATATPPPPSAATWWCTAARTRRACG